MLIPWPELHDFLKHSKPVFNWDIVTITIKVREWNGFSVEMSGGFWEIVHIVIYYFYEICRCTNGFVRLICLHRLYCGFPGTPSTTRWCRIVRLIKHSKLGGSGLIKYNQQLMNCSDKINQKIRESPKRWIKKSVDD